MAKNSTLADLDAFLKEQETSSINPKKNEISSYTKEEFVSQDPHQIVETEILAQAENKTTTKKVTKPIHKLVEGTKEDDSTMVQWAKAIDQTVKESLLLHSIPLLADITESSTEQLKATEKFLETSQNIWKKFWS